LDLIARYDPAQLPPELTAYVRDRPTDDYHQHAEVSSHNAQFVADDVVDRFCIVGAVAEHLRRLCELAELGVTQFNLYLMTGDEEVTLDIYGREIVPAFTGPRSHAGARRSQRSYSSPVTRHFSRHPAFAPEIAATLSPYHYS
jgi:hypothetical protein